MNQILQTDDHNFGNNDKKTKVRSNNPIDKKKIIIFFGAVIIVFGISMAGFFGYKMINKNKEENTEETPITDTKPKLSLEETKLSGSADEENEEKEVKIIASSAVGIDKIIYYWNDDEEIIKSLNGDTSKEIELEVPAGENQLYVKIIDMNGEEIETIRAFTVINSNQKPKIETAIVEEGKLKIVATSQIPMKYIKYSWENDDEITVEPETSDDSRIETIIDVRRGENKITITAVDYNNNRETLEKAFKGVNNPVIVVTRNNDKLYMKITHDKGIKNIVFNINETIYNYNENIASYNPEAKELEYYFSLKEGENKIVITATSIEDTVAEYRGKCNYTVE